MFRIQFCLGRSKGLGLKGLGLFGVESLASV